MNYFRDYKMLIMTGIKIKVLNENLEVKSLKLIHFFILLNGLKLCCYLKPTYAVPKA